MEERRRSTDTQIEVLTERVNQWMEQTTDYRKALCTKMDILLSRMNDLPCKQAEEFTKGLKSEINWLQKGAVGIISVLFLMGVAWGTLANTVSTNTNKWKVLEPEHQELVKDVEVLKQKSQGFHSNKAVSNGERNRV